MHSIPRELPQAHPTYRGGHDDSNQTPLREGDFICTQKPEKGDTAREYESLQRSRCEELEAF